MTTGMAIQTETRTDDPDDMPEDLMDLVDRMVDRGAMPQDVKAVCSNTGRWPRYKYLAAEYAQELLGID